MLEILNGPADAARWCDEERKAGRKFGFVPTMGALHDGHLSLIDRSLTENDSTCTSIFVNPLQFNKASDYDSYPRDIESDYDKLRSIGCHMVFSGTSQQIFPEAARIEEVQMLDPGYFARGLEGEFRGVHLTGVCTVVDRLFRITGQCRAYFGLKDYQQLLVVSDLAQRLGYPEIVPCETVREDDGLALSSRNLLLRPDQRQTAQGIYRALSAARAAWHSNVRDSVTLQHLMLEKLKLPGLEVDYAELRDPEQWQEHSPKGNLKRAVALIAATVGEVRLIDNLRLD